MRKKGVPVLKQVIVNSPSGKKEKTMTKREAPLEVLNNWFSQHTIQQACGFSSADTPTSPQTPSGYGKRAPLQILQSNNMCPIRINHLGVSQCLQQLSYLKEARGWGYAMQLHLSGIPHRRENGTIHEDLQVSRPSTNSMVGMMQPKLLIKQQSHCELPVANLFASADASVQTDHIWAKRHLHRLWAEKTGTKLTETVATKNFYEAWRMLPKVGVV